MDDAFSSPPRATTQPDVPQSEVAHDVASQIEGVPPPPPVSDSTALDESWKVDYESQLQSWRAQNAEQREKAEIERSKWESIRLQEKIEAEKRKAAGIIDEPPAAPPGPPTGGDSWEKVGSGGLSTVASSQLISFDSEAVSNRSCFICISSLTPFIIATREA